MILSGQGFIGSFDDPINLRSLFLILVIPKERTLTEHGKPADDREEGEEKKIWKKWSIPLQMIPVKSVSWQQL